MKARGHLVLGFPEGEVQARALAEAAGVPYASAAVHRFPDGESRVRLRPSCRNAWSSIAAWITRMKSWSSWP